VPHSHLLAKTSHSLDTHLDGGGPREEENKKALKVVQIIRISGTSGPPFVGIRGAKVRDHIAVSNRNEALRG
jgi:hypothetical protein